MENFTPASSLLGGALIGLSAILLLLTSGRIAGISGITYGLFTQGINSNAWRWCFLAGLILGAGSYVAYFGLPFEMPQRDLPLLLIAGFAVGFGTRLGNGCTSGHGVCGVARLSQRSLIATAVFMLTGIITVWLSQMLRGA
ncbi:MAG: YeeE/YedE family protein [Halioglobus sp.]